jgi:hypothetical protein
MEHFSEHLAEVLSLKASIAAQKLQLDRMRAAPPNTHPWIEIRKAELGLDCDRSRLRLMERAFTLKYNFDPNQPRVPAGTGDGGQWTNTGGRSYAPIPDTTPSRAGTPSAKPAPITSPKTPPVKAPPSGSWIGGAARGLARTIPGAAALAEIIDYLDWDTDVDGSITRYNRLVSELSPASEIVPVISMRARSYSREEDQTKVAIGELTRDEVKKYCPRYLLVQDLLNQATLEADATGAFPSKRDRGTNIHYRVAQKVRAVDDPNLKAEMSLLKSGVAQAEAVNDPWVPHGRDTIRIDVYDRASDKLVCVYDPKTGDKDITFSRLDEIGKTVALNFGAGTQFFVVGMRPFE